MARRYDPQPHLDGKRRHGPPTAGSSQAHTLTLTALLDTGALAAAILAHPGDEIRWLVPVRPGDTLRASSLAAARRRRRSPTRASRPSATRNQRSQTVDDDRPPAAAAPACYRRAFANGRDISGSGRMTAHTDQMPSGRDEPEANPAGSAEQGHDAHASRRLPRRGRRGRRHRQHRAHRDPKRNAPGPRAAALPPPCPA